MGQGDKYPTIKIVPSLVPFGEADRRLILAMSKAIVALAQEQRAPGFGFKYAGELAEEQRKFRQTFFPETLDEAHP